MRELVLPFARRNRDQQIVDVSQVPRGTACDCVCPSCGGPVVARQGTEREWHFAHAKGEACNDAYEKSIHELAKQMLRGRSTLLLPGLTATAAGFDAFGHSRRVAETVLEPRVARFDTCVTNQPVGDVTPDVVALEGDQRLHVEIVVFHRLGEDKRDRLVQCGVPCIEIDLSAFQSQQASRERLEAALLRGEDNRRWVFHPEYEQALAKANEKLGQALETAQGKWNSEASRRSSPSVNMPKSLAAIPRAGALREAHGLMWRASLPTVASVEAAARDLAHSKHIPEGEVLQLTAAIQRRGDLAGTTPVELSAEWAGRLGVSVDDVARFLVGAGYAL